MGARTNFHFKQDNNYLTLYSHWGGDEKFADLAYAIKNAESRWQDESYALRIMVSYLIGDAWRETTGFGLFIGETGGEEEYEPVIIDITNQTVTHDGIEHSFEDFVNYHRSGKL